MKTLANFSIFGTSRIASLGALASFTSLGSLSALFATAAFAGTTPSTTTLNALSPTGNVAYGATRTYSGAVTQTAATGSVQVLAGTTLICTGTLTGTTSKTFTCTSASIPNVGTHNITAKYLGDATYNVSTSAARSQTITKVNLTSVALASSPASPTVSTAFTLTATVTTPATTTATGAINFRNASNASLTGCGAVALTGTGATKTATCSVTETTAGAKSYTAVYAGDTNFNTLTSAAQSVTVKANSTTVLNTLTPAGAIAYATSRTYSGTVTPAAATGNAQVLAGTTVICTATLTGTTTKTFTCTSTLIPEAGTYSITAKYLGDTATNGSTSAAQSQTISKLNPTTVALASSTATPALNAAFTLTATITTPATTSATGTVNFRNAANASLATCGAVALTGTGVTKTATCSVMETSAGTKTYNALYSGDTNFNAGTNPSASVTLTAPDVATTTTVSTSAATLDYPNSPTLTATVAATPNPVTGGTVTFKRLNIDVPGCVNLTLIAQGANKIATCTPASASLPVGAHTFTALYSGVAGFTASSGTSPSLTINDPPPANNNVGNNSEASPVLVDAFYVHPDHLGTPRVVTKPADNIRVWEWESTPFGESAANENPQNVTGAGLPAAQFRFNLRFPGQFLDVESGNHYNYFRDYDSSTGRYVESDPIGLAAGVNTFGYVTGSPIGYADPNGLQVMPIPIPPIMPPVPRPGIPGFPDLPPQRPGLPSLPPTSPVLLCLISPAFCGPLLQYPPAPPQQCDDNKDKCDQMLEREEALCVAIARQWSGPGIAICKQSARQRYSECLRHGPRGVRTPLHGIDTPL